MTYSSYYGGNVGNGGIFLQLCGWLVVEHLWVGATSDTYYQEHSGIFKKQEEYATVDVVDGHFVPFQNMFDKGYCVNLMAWTQGRQEVEQPVFAQCDHNFTGLDTLKSASISTACSGNERAVKMTKISGLLTKGLSCTGCPKRLDNIWLA